MKETLTTRLQELSNEAHSYDMRWSFQEGYLRADCVNYTIIKALLKKFGSRSFYAIETGLNGGRINALNKHCLIYRTGEFKEVTFTLVDGTPVIKKVYKWKLTLSKEAIDVYYEITKTRVKLFEANIMEA